MVPVAVVGADAEAVAVLVGVIHHLELAVGGQQLVLGKGEHPLFHVVGAGHNIAESSGDADIHGFGFVCLRIFGKTRIIKKLVHKAAVRHAERCKNIFFDKILIALARNLFDDRGEQKEVGVAVHVLGVRLKLKRLLEQPFGQNLAVFVHGALVGQHLGEVAHRCFVEVVSVISGVIEFRDAGAHAHHLAERDLVAVGTFGVVFAEHVVNRQLALLLQQHHRRCAKLLADGADAVERIGGALLAGLGVGDAGRCLAERLAVLDHDRHALQIVGFHGVLQKLLFGAFGSGARHSRVRRGGCGGNGIAGGSLRAGAKRAGKCEGQ